MTEIPKIVRQRMASIVNPGMHPDADLLTAFAEQSLAERDRNSLLTHLSQCADCREVVFLATPQAENVVEAARVRSTWLGWPALRWGAAVACAVVVVAAVSLRPRSTSPAPFNEATPQVAAKLQEPALQQKAEVATAKDRVAVNRKSDVASTRRDEGAPAVARNKTAAMPESVAKQNSPAAPVMQTDKLLFAKPAAISVANQPLAVGTLAAMAKSAPAPSAPQALDQASTASENLVAEQKAPAVLGKAKEAAPAELFAAGQSAQARREMSTIAAANASQYAMKKVIPRWTLSADGTLQRSLDAGKTWKIVPVAPDATFTAVAAMAADIWVGGSHGSLYHSADAGEHWMQVVPATEGRSLTSNIIGIEFSDSLHGKVTTASQETWTTADGGQSWEITN